MPKSKPKSESSLSPEMEEKLERIKQFIDETKSE
jgi:hypothetical protein